MNFKKHPALFLFVCIFSSLIAQDVGSKKWLCSNFKATDFQKIEFSFLDFSTGENLLWEDKTGNRFLVSIAPEQPVIEHFFLITADGNRRIYTLERCEDLPQFEHNTCPEKHEVACWRQRNSGCQIIEVTCETRTEEPPVKQIFVGSIRDK